MIVFPYIYGAGGTSGQTFTFSVNGKFQYPAEVVVPTSVTALSAGVDAFQFHTEIKKITFESGRSNSQQYIPQYCFNGCTGLEEITMPDNTKIDLQGLAFNNCSSLETVTLSNSQQVILSGGNNFYNCYDLSQRSLEAILEHLASTQTTMPGGNFYGCRSITDVELPSQIVTVAGTAFMGCTSLEIAELPAVTTVGASVFSGCTSLKTLIYGAVLGSGSTAYINHASTGNVIYGCTALEDVQIPQGWTENMNLSQTSVLTHDSMVAMIANLYDYSSDTAHTLTLGDTNLTRLSADEIAVATAKNWTLS